MRIVSCRVTLFSSFFSQQQQQQHTTFFSVPSKKKIGILCDRRLRVVVCLSPSVRSVDIFLDQLQPLNSTEEWVELFSSRSLGRQLKAEKIKPYFQTSVWHQQNNNINNNSRDEMYHRAAAHEEAAAVRSQHVICSGSDKSGDESRLVLRGIIHPDDRR